MCHRHGRQRSKKRVYDRAMRNLRLMVLLLAGIGKLRRRRWRRRQHQDGPVAHVRGARDQQCHRAVGVRAERRLGGRRGDAPLRRHGVHAGDDAGDRLRQRLLGPGAERSLRGGRRRAAALGRRRLVDDRFRGRDRSPRADRGVGHVGRRSVAGRQPSTDTYSTGTARRGRRGSRRPARSGICGASRAVPCSPAASFGISQWDGAAWVDIEDPDVAPEAAGLWGFGAGDVWSASDFGTLARWDGTTWADMLPAGNVDFERQPQFDLGVGARRRLGGRRPGRHLALGRRRLDPDHVRSRFLSSRSCSTRCTARPQATSGWRAATPTPATPASSCTTSREPG